MGCVVPQFGGVWCSIAFGSLGLLCFGLGYALGFVGVLPWNFGLLWGLWNIVRAGCWIGGVGFFAMVVLWRRWGLGFLGFGVVSLGFICVCVFVGSSGVVLFSGSFGYYLGAGGWREFSVVFGGVL